MIVQVPGSFVAAAEAAFVHTELTAGCKKVGAADIMSPTAARDRGDTWRGRVSEVLRLRELLHACMDLAQIGAGGARAPPCQELMRSSSQVAARTPGPMNVKPMNNHSMCEAMAGWRKFRCVHREASSSHSAVRTQAQRRNNPEGPDVIHESEGRAPKYRRGGASKLLKSWALLSVL